MNLVWNKFGRYSFGLRCRRRMLKCSLSPDSEGRDEGFIYPSAAVFLYHVLPHHADTFELRKDDERFESRALSHAVDRDSAGDILETKLR